MLYSGMQRYSATTVDEASAFGRPFRPTYVQFNDGVGTFLTSALGQFKNESGIGVQRLSGSYTIRRLTGPDLVTQRARAATDFGTGDLNKITGVVSTGTSYIWTFDDGTDTYALPTAKTLSALINALLDGDLTADLAANNIAITSVATNAWIFIDMDDGKIYYGPGTATFGTNFTDPIPDPEITLTPTPVTWVG